jgi:hypothetical protein
MKDWRGTEIEVGDTIAYSVKHSTSVEVNEAVVTEIGKKDWGWRSEPAPFIQALWIRSSDKDWSEKYRKIRSVTLIRFSTITVLKKAPRIKKCIGCSRPKGEPHEDWCPVITCSLSTLKAS